MAKFKVAGTRVVGGVAPGRMVDLDLPEANIAALLKAGSVQRIRTAPAATTPKGGE